jgi:hypothetical protein
MQRWMQYLENRYGTPPDTAIGVGGAVRSVQAKSDGAMDAGNGLVGRIYSPTSTVSMNAADDPRYGDKASNVENIYLPAAPDAPKKGFLGEMVDWIKTL